MDYEKEYKSLVAKIKKAYLFAQTDSTKNVLVDILPELREKESEDEEIIRDIRYLLITSCEADRRYPHLLAWLERQKIFSEKGEGVYGYKDGKICFLGKWLNNSMYPCDAPIGQSADGNLVYMEDLEDEKQKERHMSAEEVLTKAGLKPFKDGNQWCILMGNNIQEGICGFGDTIEEALYQFLVEVLEKKDAIKATTAVEMIDKYIDEHLANAHEMKDSNPDKKYYSGWDDALGAITRILQDVYSGGKKKEQKQSCWDSPEMTREMIANELKPLSTEETELNFLAFLEQMGYTCIPPEKEQKPTEWSDEDDRGWDEAFMCVTRAEKAAKNEEELQNAVTAEKWLKEIKFKYCVHPVKQEWSEEDERMYKAVSIALTLNEAKGYLKSWHITPEEADTWLKSLIPKPKVEWSDEDEKMRNSIIADYERSNKEWFALQRSIPWRKKIDWLKSLRPQKNCSDCAKNIEGYIHGRSDAENKLLEQFGAIITPEGELRIKPHCKSSEEPIECLEKKGEHTAGYIRKEFVIDAIKLAFGRASMNPLNCSEAFEELLNKIEHEIH